MTRRNPNSEFAWRSIVIAAVIAFTAVIAFAGCTGTVTPERVHSAQASFDGADQNSGILKLLPHGAVVTPKFRDRYNALAKTYSRRFAPPLRRDHGLRAVPGRDHGFPELAEVWEIDNEHLVKMLEMNAWRKMGLPK